MTPGWRYPLRLLALLLWVGSLNLVSYALGIPGWQALLLSMLVGGIILHERGA